MQKTLDISEVVKRSGLPASTLRYYEDKGLIKSIGRNGLRRVFNEKVINILESISLGQLAGLTLDEIGTMIIDSNRVQIDRNKLTTKANEIEKTIAQLSAVRDGLRHAAVCPEENHFNCPKFLKLLHNANRYTKKRNKS
ncbi:MerR family transcriptional regulator [Pseudoalteromonas citrea]|uniref:MerR family transcriptional regulator n=1 Tax=Pseudoalteromonas citrea TaxID=43655 RepID=A0A5S3XTG9_9GAMM|nr:helix-turn-helix domain-containing protein [Pseudoalteromonas citrea]TMP40503.1 MerR family transcriptional regulator [Pseudoalteromonas citrea]TMP61795.1 MerR family transcriptional regulator [Pseudoalteromonas citrea]